MGQIRIFNRPPKPFEFDKEDLVIDNVRGDIYYKDDKNRLQKIIKSDDTSTSLSVANLIAASSVSSSAITSSVILTGNITASGNISSSGTIFADNFQSSGQQQITVADSFNITGSITSSGDISASGIVIANEANIIGHITASGNISASQVSTISSGTGSFRRLALGDTNVAALSAELHIRNAGSVNINLDSFDQNGNQIINFLNNQEPDFSIGNYFSDGGFQIRSDQKRFAKFGADDGDIIELSGSLHITGSNGHIITDGNITASGNISANGTVLGITGSFNQTVITLKAGAQDSPFLIRIANSNGQDNKLEMTKDGILKFGALNTLPTAITGGLAYSASAFYAGL